MTSREIAAAATDDHGRRGGGQLSRDPALSLEGCGRIAIVGRTGSGKTTLARELAAGLGVPHVELDALYFGPGFSTVALDVLRNRTHAALAGDRWVADGNKKAVRDLVWSRADTIVWLDYPLWLSLWRLGRRALRRTSTLRVESSAMGQRGGMIRQLFAGARGVCRALLSHARLGHEYPRLFIRPENRHLAVVRLRSPRAAQRWLARVANP